jgi:hypothetical protein
MDVDLTIRYLDAVNARSSFASRTLAQRFYRIITRPADLGESLTDAMREAPEVSAGDLRRGGGRSNGTSTLTRRRTLADWRWLPLSQQSGAAGDG